MWMSFEGEGEGVNGRTDKNSAFHLFDHWKCNYTMTPPVHPFHWWLVGQFNKIKWTEPKLSGQPFIQLMKYKT